MRKLRSAYRALVLTAVMAAVFVGGDAVTAADEEFAFNKHDPAVGYWVGRIDLPQMKPFIALDISSDQSGGHMARLFLLEVGSINAECDQVDVDGSNVLVIKKLVRRPMRLEAVVSDDGQSLAGTVQMLETEDGAKPDDEPKPFALHRSIKAATALNAQAFTGDLVIPGMGKLGMTLVFARTSEGNWVGSADVPVQTLLGMPLTDVSETDGTIHATMPIVMNPALIEARIDEEQNRLVGRFKQATFDLELNLPRNPGYVSPTLARPQNPKKPYPYETRDLSVPTPAGFTLAGTLTLPKEASASVPAPCAVLISGSGQQDRDETLLGHKPFLVIADRLTRAGIAVFRYDDRGVGESGGHDLVEGSTSQDFAEDAGAAVEFLKTQPEIDAGEIGLIGHSEGGLIAPMVTTARDDVAFIVLLAGPGVTGREILELQGKLILKAEGQSEEDIRKFSDQQTKLLDLAVSGASEDEIAKAVEAVRDEAGAATQPEGDPAEDDALEEQQIKAQVEVLTNAWMKFFLTHDPRPTLAKVKCPVLAVNGTLDLQVWHEQNLPEIEKALSGAGADFTIKRYDNLNHLFQPARTGGMSEYAASEITFDESVLADVIQWISSRTGGE